MKKNNIYILTIILLLICTSCEDWLAVSPKSQIEAEVLFETEQGFDDALTGIYIALSDEDTYGQYLTWHVIENVGHQYDVRDSRYEEMQNFDYENSTSEYVIEDIWLQEYKTIAQINLLVESIEEYGNVLETEKRNLIKAQALALRALCHFDLLRLFGHGNLENRTDLNNTLTIPYVTRISKTPEDQRTYEETFQLLEKDIEDALGLFILAGEEEAEDGVYFDKKAHMNLDALRVLQGRVFLWQGKKAEALKAVEPLFLNSYAWGGKATSAESNTFSSEHLFHLNVTTLGENIEDYYEKYLNGSFNDDWLYQHKYFIKPLFDFDSGEGASDIRYLEQHYYYSSSYCLSIKLQSNEESTIADYLVPMLKIGEAYLIAIECYASDIEGGDLAKAIELMNFFKEKRNIRPEYFLPDTATAEDVQAAVYKEYRKEFIQEGQIFYFYKRKGVVSFLSAKRTTINDMDDSKYIFPYPDGEIEYGRVQSI